MTKNVTLFWGWTAILLFVIVFIVVPKFGQKTERTVTSAQREEAEQKESNQQIQQAQEEKENIGVTVEMRVEEGGQDVIKPASECAIKLLGEKVREEVSLWFTNYNVNTTKYGNGRLEYTVRLDGKFHGNTYGEKSFQCEVDISNGCSGKCSYQ